MACRASLRGRRKSRPFINTNLQENTNMNTIEIPNRPNRDSQLVVYTAKTHTTGGRDGGGSRTSDGRLDIKFTIPGGHGSGTNPEQLFAATAVAAGDCEFNIQAAIR